MVNTEDPKFKDLKKSDKEAKLDKIIEKIDEKIGDRQFYVDLLNSRKSKLISFKNNL